MQFETGNTFKIDFDELKGQYNVTDDHLWVIISEVTQGQPVVLVNCSSWKQNHPKNDPTCILKPCDHPALHQKSFVYYARPKIFKIDTIRRGWKAGAFRLKADMRNDILEEIQKGVLESERIPSRYQAVYLQSRDSE